MPDIPPVPGEPDTGPEPQEPSDSVPQGQRGDGDAARGGGDGSGPGTPQGSGAQPVPPVPNVRQGSAQYPHAHPDQPWPPPVRAPQPWLASIRPEPAGRVRWATLWCALGTALLSTWLLGDGLGPNLLIVALGVAGAAHAAASRAGRRLRPWTAVWVAGSLVLLVVPALRDAGWPTFLAVVSSLALGSLALHGGRSWSGIVFGSVGVLDSLVTGPVWGFRGLREHTGGSRGRWGGVVRTVVVAAVLLLVFGALFAGADAAFADLLGELTPDVSASDAPWRVLLFLLGLAGALAAAHTAAAPLRWDRLSLSVGRARGRMEWAVPLIVLDLLFAVFIAVQLAVLFGGYDKVLRETGLTYAEYARQGFWQLLWATLLTLVVIGLALRWAPRDGARDRTLVHGVLGPLCVLTLIVVASALRRMDLYVDAYGLTRLRISVAAMELWLGMVIVLIVAAGLFGGRWLPRAVAASCAATVLAFGLASPDALVAERNVQRYENTGKIDIGYLKGLSADAVPALDTLPEPLRSCALEDVQRDLRDAKPPWYATSWGQERARRILAERPAVDGPAACPPGGRHGGLSDEHDGGAGAGDYDPGTGMD
ncbi:DUF4153 domain-containing protein [Streptomyces sp. NPDC059169]|uniref:DUF4153 domain-containing protein n=1 Tax=Streptomyces sp. NPDC059169 TaxID=3346754 RepID=UPI0036960349